MAGPRTQNHPHTAQTEADPRASLREARKRRLRLLAGGRPVTVKVYAANETIREVLRHANGTRFRDKLDQGVEWPNDTFTARRIADGSVRTDGPGSGEAVAEDEALNAREHAAARKPKEEAPRENSRRGSHPEHQPEPPQPAA